MIDSTTCTEVDWMSFMSPNNSIEALNETVSFVQTELVNDVYL